MGGVKIEIDQSKIDHVNTVLRGAPEKIKGVFRRAMERGVTAGKEQASREVRKRYDIREADVDKYSTVFGGVGMDGTVGYIRYWGKKIPLYNFHTSPERRKYTNRYVNRRSGWRVTSPVRAADSREKGMRDFPRGFIATMYGRWGRPHTGIYFRTGEKTKTGKPKLRQYWSYSIADMLNYEPAREAIRARGREIVEKNIDHELMRVLEEKG